MDNTEENKYSVGGGVLESRLIQADIVFSGWRNWANEGEHRIKMFTELGQIGIDDSMLSETDFFANIQLIAEAMPAYSRLEFCIWKETNLSKSLMKQMIVDRLFEVNTNSQDGIMRLEKIRNLNMGVPIEYRLSYNDIRYVSRYDIDGSTKILYPFKVEATFLSTINITPLNGWAFTDFKLGKVGNCAVFTFTTKKSENIKTNGTVIAKFPEEYRPKIGIAFSAIANTSKHNARFVVRPSGEVAVYDVDDSVYVIDCSGVFFTD